MKKILFVLFAVATLSSCEQYITRQYGGNTTIKLEKGEKLIEATWKGEGILLSQWIRTIHQRQRYSRKVRCMV